MDIKGYYGPLVDGGALTSDRLFWPAYLLDMTEGEYVDLMEPAFGVTEKDLEPLLDHLHDRERWPVLTIPLPGDCAIRVVYHNFEGEEGIDFLLDDARWDSALQVANVSGHFQGPGLSWAELVRLSGRTATGSLAPAQRMMLLLPTLGDAGLPADAASTVTAALTACGATGVAVKELARALLDGGLHLWAAARWRRDGDDLVVCDGEYSPRNPAGAFGLPANELRAITRICA
jgi:hypothetical protein